MISLLPWPFWEVLRVVRLVHPMKGNFTALAIKKGKEHLLPSSRPQWSVTSYNSFGHYTSRSSVLRRFLRKKCFLVKKLEVSSTLVEENFLPCIKYQEKKRLITFFSKLVYLFEFLVIWPNVPKAFSPNKIEELKDAFITLFCKMAVRKEVHSAAGQQDVRTYLPRDFGTFLNDKRRIWHGNLEWVSQTSI